MPQGRTPSPHGPRLVVGYDGSPASLAAVHAAARQAGPDGSLIVLHAYASPPEQLGWPLYESAARDAERAAQALLDRLREDRALTYTRWTGEVVAGPTAEVLDAAARNHDADAIFVGARGAGRARALLGSVANQLLHLADRPVTVIPRRAVGFSGTVEDDATRATGHARQA